MGVAWKYKDRIIRVGRSWRDDSGTKHPYNWVIWSDEEKKQAGLVRVEDSKAEASSVKN